MFLVVRRTYGLARFCNLISAIGVNVSVAGVVVNIMVLAYNGDINNSSSTVMTTAVFVVITVVGCLQILASSIYFMLIRCTMRTLNEVS